MKKQRQIDRVLLLIVGFLLWFAAIVARLVYLQIYQHDEFVRLAIRQQRDTIEVESNRGVIYDRKMHELAVSVDVKSVYANPREVKDRAGMAARLAPVLKVSRETLEKRLSMQKSFVWLKRKVAFAVEKELNRTKFPGVQFLTEPKRFYPNKELAAQLLGLVGIDNHGLDGLELRYDQELKGSPGMYLVQRDAKQKILGSEIKRKPVPGNTLVLNLDKTIQFIVEKELSAAVERHRANHGTAILMNPSNGEVLAMATYPGFDPNRFQEFSPSRYRNRAVADIYEPGSTFKIVTIGSALDGGYLDPDEEIDCRSGSITLANHTIRDHVALGRFKYTEILAHSSNVGAIKIGLRLGAERFYQRMISFGFGRKTRIDLPGEAKGLLRVPEKWSAVSGGFIAMGYEVGVTAIQMLSAVSTVANGGYGVTPRVLQRIISPEGELIYQAGVERRRVLRHKTAILLRRALEKVVEEGTGKAAKMETYRVAGKTGTTKKPENGTYSNTKYVASFMGFAPAISPAFAAIVVIDEPKGDAYYGGEVAAPVFKGIAEKVLRYLEVPPERQPAIEYLTRAAPNSVQSYTDTPTQLSQVSIIPSPAASLEEQADVVVVNSEENSLVMPEFRGKAIRSVIEECAALDIELTYHGAGVAVRQIPAAGTRLVANTSCKVWFARPPSARMRKAAPARRRGDRSGLIGSALGPTAGGVILTPAPSRVEGNNE